MAKSLDDIRNELRDLIGEALIETDDGRRHGLLTLADHWAFILRRRTGRAGKA